MGLKWTFIHETQTSINPLWVLVSSIFYSLYLLSNHLLLWVFVYSDFSLYCNSCEVSSISGVKDRDVVVMGRYKMVTRTNELTYCRPSLLHGRYNHKTESLSLTPCHFYIIRIIWNSKRIIQLFGVTYLLFISILKLVKGKLVTKKESTTTQGYYHFIITFCPYLNWHNR